MTDQNHWSIDADSMHAISEGSDYTGGNDIDLGR
jgi:hypothetical protein